MQSINMFQCSVLKPAEWSGRPGLLLSLMFLMGFQMVAVRYSSAEEPSGTSGVHTIAETPRVPQLKSLSANPAYIMLNEPDETFTLLIEGTFEDGSKRDLTRESTLKAESNRICSLDSTGEIRAIQAGSTNIHVQYGNQSTTIQVEVRQNESLRPLHFESDMIPIFNRYGCNGASCHGKAEGQNGFKLSVFGFDPMSDYLALRSESRGRRVFPAVPEQSLLLKKICGETPHGGGIRIRKESPEYRLIQKWISQGLPLGSVDHPTVSSIEITPRELQMKKGTDQQLRVMATFSDGSKRDVTRHAVFQTNTEAIANVTETGLVSVFDIPGSVAIMASYRGQVDIFRAFIPQESSVKIIPPAFVSSLSKFNPIDNAVFTHLNKLKIIPADLCTDEEFIRRLFLDIIGTLPSPEETRNFLKETDPHKRSQLVKTLLNRPEYADYWAMKWSDLLRVDRQTLGYKGAYQYYSWIRKSFAEGKPFDQFATELITAEGNLNESPAGYFYQVVKKPGDQASTLSQVFLGMRIECAQCHHHPFDRWSQQDYAGMQDFFAQLSFKSTSRGSLLGAFSSSKQTKHPRTGEVVVAHYLGTTMGTDVIEEDRRKDLATALIDPKRRDFARNVVNRYWAAFTGRGIIEPVDDIRLTNPPSNPELLERLTDSFIQSDHDVKRLIFQIATSKTYQLSTQPNLTNQRDSQNYSRAKLRSLPAEVLLDAICEVTGVPEKFQGLPASFRAIQLWDSHTQHDFLRLFGRPVRASSCECERTSQPNVSQVLHLLNASRIQEKLSHPQGRVARLLVKFPASQNDELIEELYLRCYSRFPSEEEKKRILQFLNHNQENRDAAVEDLLWSMINTVEFLFNH